MSFNTQIVARLIDSGRLAEIIELCGETNNYEYIAETIIQFVDATEYEVSAALSARQEFDDVCF